jgi:mono/diheme cytochrome c family protein
MKPSLSRVCRDGLPVFLILAFWSVLLSSCGGISRRDGVTPTQAHMFAHFDRAGEVHDALVRGELGRAQEAAEWIATHQDTRELPGNHPELEAEMQHYASLVSLSSELRGAAQAAAHMGRTCGDCHRLNDVSPRFLIGTAPPGGTGAQAEMARHVWAAERMWEGLVGPGDRAWGSGAEALKSGWLDPQQVVSNPEDRPRIRELVGQVYVLGMEAESATDAEARAEIYGEFLTTCNECHVLTAARIR